MTSLGHPDVEVRVRTHAFNFGFKVQLFPIFIYLKPLLLIIDKNAERHLKTFNYDGGYHLSNQNQVQCIRREKGNCKICYSTSTNTDLAVSGNAASNFDTVDCCWYKADGMGTMRDCVIIPSLSKTTGAPLKFGNFCGRAGLGTAAGALAANAIKTICSTKTF